MLSRTNGPSALFTETAPDPVPTKRLTEIRRPRIGAPVPWTRIARKAGDAPLAGVHPEQHFFGQPEARSPRAKDFLSRILAH